MSNQQIERVIAESIDIFRKHDRAASEYAVGDLVALGDSASDYFLKALSDPDTFVREGIAQALGILGNQQAVSPLLQAAQNKELAPGNKEGDDAYARAEAVIALGALGNPSVATTLSEILEDRTSDPWLRYCAAIALGQVGNASAYDLLLQTFKSNNEDELTRRGAAEGLGFLGDRRALDPLLLALDQLIQEKTDWAMKCSIAQALSLLNDKRAVGPLIRLLKDERAEVVIQSARALGKLGDSRALHELSWLQNHCEDRFLGFAIKHYVTEAMQKINAG
jgi:HEAT repeat protein